VPVDQPEESTEDVDENVVPEEPAPEEELAEDNSIKDAVQSFLGMKEEEPQVEDENDLVAEEPIPEVDESTEDEVTEDNSIKDAVQSFLGIKEETTEAPEEQITPEETAAEEPEIIEDQLVPPDEMPEEHSIKDAVQTFLGLKDEEEVVEDPTPSEEPAVEELATTEEEAESETSPEGSCDDLPHDKTLREKFMSFCGFGGEAEVPVDQPEESTEDVDEVVVPEEAAPEEEIAEDNSIKDAVQSFLGIKEEPAPEVEETVASEDNSAEETDKIDDQLVPSDELESEPEKTSLKEKIVEFFTTSDDSEDSETVIEAETPEEETVLEETAVEETTVEETTVEETPEEVANEEIDQTSEDEDALPIAEEETEEIEEEEEVVDKPSFKQRIINFFTRSKPEEVIPEEIVPESEPEEKVPEIKVKESLKTRIGNFFKIFQSKDPVSDLETEIAETIVNGKLDEMMENSEKEPIVIDTIGMCPEITKENWLQLFMGRSFLCFVSFSLNLSVLIASYLLYF